MNKPNFRTTALSAAMGLALLAGSAAAETELNLEGPADHSIVTGLVHAFGWAASNEGVAGVELLMDGRPTGWSVAYGATRNDVAAAFPNIPDATDSGFAVAFNSRLFGNGEHTLTLRVTDTLGQVESDSHTIYISNPPSGQDVTGEVDLSQATARISNGRLFLDNVVIDGVAHNNIDLAFDNLSNSFRIAAFVEDADGDGYRDDDLDRDGYHDDDLDRDGFHDDDEDHDGFHDDIDDDMDDDDPNDDSSDDDMDDDGSDDDPNDDSSDDDGSDDDSNDDSPDDDLDDDGSDDDPNDDSSDDDMDDDGSDDDPNDDSSDDDRDDGFDDDSNDDSSDDDRDDDGSGDDDSSDDDGTDSV